MIITRAMPTQQTAITGVSRRITAGQEIKAELCRGPGFTPVLSRGCDLDHHCELGRALSRLPRRSTGRHGRVFHPPAGRSQTECLPPNGTRSTRPWRQRPSHRRVLAFAEHTATHDAAHGLPVVVSVRVTNCVVGQGVCLSPVWRQQFQANGATGSIEPFLGSPWLCGGFDELAAVEVLYADRCKSIRRHERGSVDGGSGFLAGGRDKPAPCDLSRPVGTD